MSRPYLIITNGPTGSGKSSLVEKTIHHYNLNQNHQKFLIDDLVENNAHYKKAIDMIIRVECSRRQMCQQLKNKLNEPNKDWLQKWAGLYRKYRGSTGEKWCDGGRRTCDESLDLKLSESIGAGDNLVFETVGTYYVKWLIDMTREQYDVYYAFTLLDSKENIDRNKYRAQYQMSRFIKDRTSPAPRLPDVSEKYFHTVIRLVYSNLASLMLLKSTGSLSEVDNIIVFDNSWKSCIGKSSGVIYASDQGPTEKSGVLKVLRKIQALLNVPMAFLQEEGELDKAQMTRLEKKKLSRESRLHFQLNAKSRRKYIQDRRRLISGKTIGEVVNKLHYINDSGTIVQYNLRDLWYDIKMAS